MNLRNLLTLNLVFAIFFGVSCTVFPGWVLQLYGLPASDAAIWTTRLVGGSILGFATLMWFGRSTPAADTRRAIALALLVQDLVGLIASVEIQLTGSVDAFGWTNIFLYGFLSLGYAYFYFVPSAHV
jgi:hypothetical protein